MRNEFYSARARGSLPRSVKKFMSRVDEARRRASGRHNDDRGFADATSVVPGQEQGLENYPRERGNVSVERSSRIQRPISAPRSTESGHLGSLDAELNGKLVGSAETMGGRPGTQRPSDRGAAPL